MSYSRAPYFYRRFQAWQAMADDEQGLADTGGCIDAPELLPSGASDCKEDLPSPTYVTRETD